MPNNLVNAGETYAGYLMEKPLGSGSFGEVWLATRNGMKFAAKFIHAKNLIEVEAAKREIETQVHLSSDYIVKIVDVPEDCVIFKGNVVLLLVIMELCDGTLSVLIRPDLSLRARMAIANSVIAGVAAIHEMGGIHRDLKPENILVKDGMAKIADFGLAKAGFNPHEYLQTFAGTIFYMAPEVIAQRPYKRSADIWSLGCILAEVALGKRLIERSDKRPPCVLAEGGLLTANSPLMTEIPDQEMRDLVEMCFVREPKGRPSALSLLRATVFVMVRATFGLLTVPIHTYAVTTIGTLKQMLSAKFNVGLDGMALILVKAQGQPQRTLLSDDLRLFHISYTSEDTLELAVRPRPGEISSVFLHSHVRTIPGNILDIESDGMIVSHNNYFHMSNVGFQKVLMAKLGPQHKEAIDIEARKYAPMPLGGLFVTRVPRGVINATVMLHLVTHEFRKPPTEKKPPKNHIAVTRANLIDIVTKALQQADKLKLKSVVLPSVIARNFYTVKAPKCDDEIRTTIEMACRQYKIQNPSEMLITIVHFEE